jgi:iron complex outermembrane receptor protein
VLKSRALLQYTEAVTGFLQEWTAHGTGAAITTVTSTTVQPVPQCFSLDLRLGWEPTKNVEFSIVGQDLLSNQHLEFGPSLQMQKTGVESNIYGKVTWSF